MRLICRIVLMAVICCRFCPGAWQSIGPFGGSLRCCANAPSNENVFYAATNASPVRIFYSSDQGSTWTKVSTLADSYIYSLEVDPTNYSIVYANGYNTVYRSTNGGAAWTPYAVPGAYNLCGLSIDNASPNILFVVGQFYNSVRYVMGVFKSTNSGQTWSGQALNAYSGLAYAVGIDPADHNTVYVGGYYNDNTYNIPRVYKSTNGGSVFTDMSSGIDTLAYSVNSVAVNRSSSLIVHAGTYSGGIYRTTNGGVSWSRVEPNAAFVGSIATTPASSTVVFAGADTSVYKSTDSGATWFRPGVGYGGSYKMMRDVCVGSASALKVYTADSKGFFKSVNGGTDWQSSSSGIVISPVATFGAVTPAPSTMYTEYEGVGVYKTTDNGTSWSLLPTPLSCGSICEFACHNTNPAVVMGLEGLG